MKQRWTRWSLLVTLIVGFALSAGAAKKVHTLGDSTMAPYDESTTNTRGWGMYFGNFLTNGWTSINYAKGGRDSREGYTELWQNAKNSVEAGDYVLIQFAHNDEKYNGIDNLELQEYYTQNGDPTNAAAVKSDGRGTKPSTTYKACLKQIIDEVKAKGAIPVLVSAVCRCYFNGGTITKAGQHNLADKYDAIVNGVIMTNQKLTTDDHSMDYSYQMQQLAIAENVAFIDMTTATKKLYEGYETYEKCYAALFDKGDEVDNTHYNLTGALTAARMCAQLMKEQGLLTDAIVVPTDLSFNPAQADLGEVYVGQSATKEITLSGLGLDPASGTVTMTASEGILLSNDKQNWQSEVTADYTDGTLIKTIYAKVNITATGIFNGTVTATLGEKTATSEITVTGIELGGGTPFTTTWDLTANDQAVTEGLATAADAQVAGMVKYGNNGQKGLMVSTSEGGAWVRAEDDSPNQYVQFTVTAPDGQKLDINHIAMKVGGHGGGGMRCHVYYSTDGFVTRTTIYSPTSMSSGVMNDVDVTPVIKLEEGDQLQIRVYPWYTNDATGKWLCISNVLVEGQSKDAAGVNIPGTITYKLDKGGLADNDDAVVLDPNELSAGFAAKKWSYDGTNEKVVIEGTTFQGASGNTPMMQLRYNAASTETLSTTADRECTISLTLTPEDGFSFVPSRVSFLAGKFNSGNPHLTFAIEAGENRQVLKDNVEINRSKTNPLVDPSSFNEEISGVTATADSPLKLKFSFLNVQGTRSAGIGNLVIEGTLVGAAAQVTKYALTTQVVPSAEAGTITREPDLEMYKEGSQVTLKATKNFGYQFKEWQDATGAQVSTDAETIVTMDAEKTLKAVFEQIPVYTVKTQVTNDADRDGLGSITLSPNEHNGQYEAGTKVTATANESKILKFTNWEDNSSSATREITVNGDMTIVANYEVQDFIAVFDASNTSAYATASSYPFAADVTWDANRHAKVSVVKQSDGSLITGTNATPVVRNRANSGVLTTLSGVFQNGYNTAEIAWQYQFSTVGFTTARFEADMAAKNAATVNWKAQISTDGSTYNDLGEAWTVTANTLKPLSFTLPAEAIGKETVYIRIMGTGDALLSDKYDFNAGTSPEGLAYATNSEAQIGNVFILGDAIVEADEVAPKLISTIPADGAEGVSASGKITITFDERIETANSDGAVTLGNEVLTPTWSSKSVSFEYKQLEYDQAYTFSMPANYVQDKSGNKYAEAITFTFKTMNRPEVEKAVYDAMVSTVEELVAAINEANSRPDKNTRYSIFIKKGTYKMPKGAMKHYIHQNNERTITYWEGDLPDPITYIKAPNISFIGEDRDETIITQDISNDKDMLFEGGFGTVHKYEEIGYSEVFQLESTATATYFQDLTIKSGINDKLGRNLAVHDKSTKTVYKNTVLYGYQDTWTSNNQNGVYYFEGGVVRGCTDFICGSGDAFFDKVNIIMCESGGYVVAPRDNQKYGYVFKDCNITGNANVSGTYYLGRAWTAQAETYFINTTMEVQPAAAGWRDWNNGPTRFAEYNSMNASGAEIDLSNRATSINGTANNPILTPAEAEVIGNINNTFGDWQPTLLTEEAPVVTNVELNGTLLTWTGNNYSLLYAICLNDEVVATTVETSFDISTLKTSEARSNAPAADPVYAVRAANAMGGLSAPVVAQNTTGIQEISTHDTTGLTKEIYTIDGKRVSALRHGINIVRYQSADGTVKTVKVMK